MYVHITLIMDSLDAFIDGHRESKSFKCFSLLIESRLLLVQPKNHFFVRV